MLDMIFQLLGFMGAMVIIYLYTVSSGWNKALWGLNFVLYTIALIMTANYVYAEPVKTFIVKTGVDPKHEPEVKVITKEKIIVQEPPKNHIRLIGGVTMDSISKVETQEIRHDNGEKKTEVKNLPSDDELLYGFGYDRNFGSFLLGGSYIRNKPRTNEIIMFNVGVSW